MNGLIIGWTYRWKSPPAPLFQRGELLPLKKGGQEGFAFVHSAQF